MNSNLIASVNVPLPNNPTSWARDQIDLGWTQILAFTAACVGVTTVFLVFRAFRG